MAGGSLRLGPNRYGKAEVRVVRVTRGDEHRLRDWNVSVSLSGDLDAVHLAGDNTNVLPTDTQKNTVYAFTQRLGDVEPEVLALALAAHFVTTPITRARVTVDQYAWTRLGPHSFARDGAQIRSCGVVHDRGAGAVVTGGVRDLVLMNTTDSEFHGFARDDYTTLAETRDRVLATSVDARWRFRTTDADWGAAFEGARSALLAAFVDTYSYSLQQTLYAMGSAVLEAVPAICEVRLVLPNKHHFLVDLAPFGLVNDNEVYYAADRPFGQIEGHVLAADAPDAALAWDG
jgi:urate oxidase